ncbi:SHOCT domain-containing protein [Euzebya rosea]|uniref:SHOCT domain-containing protein n=1 Tax=Euzebya rosea TaxID=2052804 RepID=UPI00196B2CC5|nr:hypothetical protein [Euzebya rosea]
MTLITATNTLLAQAGGWWDHMSGWGGGWMWLWGTLMMLSWVAIIAGAVWVVLRGRDGDARSRARDLLQERYARGEIDTEEYRERLEQLT